VRELVARRVDAQKVHQIQSLNGRFRDFKPTKRTETEACVGLLAILTAMRA